MDGPPVSILVTSHNYERFLADAIESTLHQDYPRVEVIVVDDGSTDGSVALARSFPVKVLERDHQGLAAALWEGTIHAKGEFVVILNADDLLHPSFVSETMAAVQGRERAFAYVGSHLFGPAAGGPLGAFRMRARPFSLELLRLGPYMICAGPVPRQAILDVGGWDTSLPVLEDWDFWIRVAEAGYVGIPVDKPLYYYRHHSTNSRNRASKRRNARTRRQIWTRHGGQTLPRRVLYHLRTARLAPLFVSSLLSPKATEAAADWLAEHDPFPGPLLEPVTPDLAEPAFGWLGGQCQAHGGGRAVLGRAS